MTLLKIGKREIVFNMLLLSLKLMPRFIFLSFSFSFFSFLFVLNIKDVFFFFLIFFIESFYSFIFLIHFSFSKKLKNTQKILKNSNQKTKKPKNQKTKGGKRIFQNRQHITRRQKNTCRFQPIGRQIDDRI